MTLRDTIRRSGRSLRSAKIRTILTSLAIAVGGFTLTATLAAGNGVRAYTDRLVKSNFDPSELIVGRDKEIAKSGTPSGDPKEYDDSVSSLTVGGNGSTLQIKQVTTADVSALKKLPFAEKVRENFQLSPRYITRPGFKKYTVTAQAYNPAQKPEVKAGKLPSSGDIDAGSITIPDNYINVLDYKNADDAIGKQVTLNIQAAFSGGSPLEILASIQKGTDVNTLKPAQKDMTYTVAAVTKKAATTISFGALPVLLSGMDAKTVYDYTVKSTNNYGKYIYVYVRVKDGTNKQNIDIAKAELAKLGYFTQSSDDVQKSITQVVNVLQIMVGVFGLITVIASVFGIVNTQYISVLERTREIGLMKALGMRARDIRRLFMLEAGWIGFLGGAIGAGAGVIVGVLLNPFITKKLDLGAGNSLLIFKPWQIALLILSLIIVAMLAGFLPARKAAKLDPIEALRTE
jgi:putative ABC transport system permease protein